MMRCRSRSLLILSICSFLATLVLSTTIPSGTGKEKAKPFGIESRVLWTTSRVVGSPDPPTPYITERVFDSLTFESPTVLTSAPGTDRMFVATGNTGKGRVFFFEPSANVVEAKLLLDLGRRDIYGMAFDPKFASNGYFYLFITERKPTPPRTRIARFQVKPDNPLQADPESEHIILEFPSAGHNGGGLKFGPDGFLYIGVGDGGSSNDPNETGQFLGDLLATILRIDVHGKHSAKSYAIPPGNPFINTPGALPEIWAYGLRQPWRFSFDRQTGELWVGDVGQDLWESVYRVHAGGNYGWSINEGPQPFRPHRKQGPNPIEPPVIAHGHGEARSITGGFVYRGARLKELNGAYIYADYETGKIWGLRHDGQKLTWHQELADTRLDIADFGEDNSGELYLLTHVGGQIYRLVPAPRTPDTSRTFPRRLSETGLFTSVKIHRPAPGLIPYSVNSPLWSDHAEKERFIALPGDSRIEYEPSRGWKFPEGSVLVKTFSMEMERGKPASRRRLETRIMTLQRGEWAGYTYLWNEAQTDADLLGPGRDTTFTVVDPQEPGGRRSQTYHFPSRAECMICHNEKANFILGLRTEQMNRDYDYGEVSDNQIRTLAHLDVFTKPVPLDRREAAPAGGSAGPDPTARGSGSFLSARQLRPLSSLQGGR